MHRISLRQIPYSFFFIVLLKNLLFNYYLFCSILIYYYFYLIKIFKRHIQGLEIPVKYKTIPNKSNLTMFCIAFCSRANCSSMLLLILAANLSSSTVRGENVVDVGDMHGDDWGNPFIASMCVGERHLPEWCRVGLSHLRSFRPCPKHEPKP